MKLKYLFLGLLFLGLLWAKSATAQICQLCVVTIGAGLGLSRWLGIDDVVSSVWIGALLVSIILWTLMYLKKKGWSFQNDGVVITLVYILLIYIPLYYVGIIGNSENQIFRLDKIIFGSSIGLVAFFIGYWINLYMKKKNNGKAFFSFQKVVIPILALIITSLILWRII
ncbi:MAG: hypothetical protein AAB509_02285 [Patescibacteria group bacterium]